jgi:transposase
MKRFVEGTDRKQSTLFAECLDDWIDENNPVRAIDAFVETLDLAELGFEGVEPAETGRPAYHPSALLKLYVYGYLNRVQSSRRLEREAGRNVEMMWLLGRLVPDHKTVADFRKDNGRAIRKVCARTHSRWGHQEYGAWNGDQQESDKDRATSLPLAPSAPVPMKISQARHHSYPTPSLRVAFGGDPRARDSSHPYAICSG